MAPRQTVPTTIPIPGGPQGYEASYLQYLSGQQPTTTVPTQPTTTPQAGQQSGDDGGSTLGTVGKTALGVGVLGYGARKLGPPLLRGARAVPGRLSNLAQSVDIARGPFRPGSSMMGAGEASRVGSWTRFDDFLTRLGAPQFREPVIGRVPFESVNVGRDMYGLNPILEAKPTASGGALVRTAGTGDRLVPLGRLGYGEAIPMAERAGMTASRALGTVAPAVDVLGWGLTVPSDVPVKSDKENFSAAVDAFRKAHPKGTAGKTPAQVEQMYLQSTDFDTSELERWRGGGVDARNRALMVGWAKQEKRNVSQARKTAGMIDDKFYSQLDSSQVAQVGLDPQPYAEAFSKRISEISKNKKLDYSEKLREANKASREILGMAESDVEQMRSQNRQSSGVYDEATGTVGGADPAMVNQYMAQVQPYIDQAVYDGEAKAQLLESYASQVGVNTQQGALMKMMAANVREQGLYNANQLRSMVLDIPRQLSLRAQAEAESAQTKGYNSYINAYYGALGRQQGANAGGGGGNAPQI